MRVRHVPRLDVESVLDPHGSVWREARSIGIEMLGTPLALQPTEAIRTRWAGKKIGAVEHVELSAVHDGNLLAFRLEWSDPTENAEASENDVFIDGAAVLLPVVPGALVSTMGEPGKPVNAWYWRADEARGFEVIAEGIGTSQTLDSERVRSRGVWKGGKWRVVLARAMRVDTKETVAQLESGARTGFAVAVWDGASGERAGIKAFSGEWREMVLETPPAARG